MAWPPTGTLTMTAEECGVGDSCVVYLSFTVLYSKGYLPDNIQTKIDIFDGDTKVGSTPPDTTHCILPTCNFGKSNIRLETSAKQTDPAKRLTAVLYAKTI